MIVWKNPSIFPHSINSMYIHNVMNLKKINLLVLVGVVTVIVSVMTAAADDPLDRSIVEGENDGDNNLIIAPSPDDPTDEVIVTSYPDCEDEPADDEILLDPARAHQQSVRRSRYHIHQKKQGEQVQDRRGPRHELVTHPQRDDFPSHDHKENGQG